MDAGRGQYLDVNQDARYLVRANASTIRNRWYARRSYPMYQLLSAQPTSAKSPHDFLSTNFPTLWVAPTGQHTPDHNAKRIDVHNRVDNS